MGYPGYPQQNWQGGGHPRPPGYAGPVPDRSGPGLAITSGILGLGAGGVLLTQTIMLLSDIPSGVEVPTGWTVMNVMHFAVVGIVLLGAVLVFARQLAGAFLLVAGAVLTVAVLLLDPALAEGVWGSMLGALPDFEPSGDYANYFKAMFEFGNEQAVLRFVAFVLGVILLTIAVLPPSLDWLRGPTRSNHDPYRQGW
ncbi:hypothetical protein [Actinophytocola glycyrrhizae]|uniref:Uncharacterized protein n=1 Tax=Actinophytocola glycyrrhizae TaxID=2044873 RepID=A0ABV9RUW5_9PSEU